MAKRHTRDEKSEAFRQAYLRLQETNTEITAMNLVRESAKIIGLSPYTMEVHLSTYVTPQEHKQMGLVSRPQPGSSALSCLRDPCESERRLYMETIRRFQGGDPNRKISLARLAAEMDRRPFIVDSFLRQNPNLAMMVEMQNI